ncbi:putative gustatory receptor 93c [Drosophila navojoa]|uniref:putative gustatory receptor 93c n=1 Tax=Drosophila navojoa TaxID=7232 RepID=UPI0008477A1F|nr:putative gustatory receptor 93c [Drosophila navojoa]
MFGRRRQLSASSLSANILHVGFRYATFLGIICFGIEGNRTDGCLVAQNRFWYKWFCLLTRLLICVIYGYLSLDYIFTLDNSHLIILSWIRLVCCLICAFVTLTMQFWFGQHVLRVVNSYLRLFRKVNALPGSQASGFGGRRELSLLIFKMICLINEVFCELPELFDGLSIRLFVTILCDLYVTTNATMIGHLCFVGYLSVGALYARVNHYVRHELRRQLQGLEQPTGCEVSRGQLRAAGCRLDQCLAIYDDIQRVGSAFHRLMELPLCLILLFAFLSMTLVSYFIMLQRFRNVALWLLVARLFFDVVLLTLAIHGASSSSRVVRRLSLDNCYVTERNDWHMKLEMFLGRLNFFEFRVRPLGLFEISNELILVFLSGLVTYLTYIIQYGMQSNKI